MENGIHSKLYVEYNKALRGWFVGYGIGGVVLIATNPDVFGQLNAALQLLVVLFFLMGVFMQILGVLLNKYVNLVAQKYHDTPAEPGPLARALQWVANQIWIDFIIDLTTFFAFALSTFLVLIGLYLAIQRSSP